MCDLCLNPRGPRPLVVAPDDASEWARVLRVVAEGPAAAERWNRLYLEHNGLVERVEQLAHECAGIRRETRADLEEDNDHG